MKNFDREQLTNIIEENDGLNWWKPSEFEIHIRERLPKELELVSPPPAYSDNYNCFVFALGLQNDSDFLGDNNPIQKEFILHLLKLQILESKDQGVSGDLIFYIDDTGAITHSGIVQEQDYVLSKWMWGPTCKHKTFEVPSSFGNKVFFSKPADTSIIKDTYTQYKNSGVEIEPIS